MLGKLTDNDCLQLLERNVTGRLGCHANGKTYVIPINYVFKHNTIYAHSAEGEKIAMMRQDPNVCFQVDEIRNVFNWKSVIAWGRFEEITNLAEKQQIMQSLIHRIMPLVTTPTGHPSHGITENDSDVGTTVDLIIYKIPVNELTGRYEMHIQ